MNQQPVVLLCSIKEQDGHCPGNQGKVRKIEKERGKSRRSQGMLAACPDVQGKSLPLINFNFMISVSAKMPHKEVIGLWRKLNPKRQQFCQNRNLNVICGDFVLLVTM